MVGNCEKMLLISSPSNEWSELVYDENKNQLDDPKGNLNNTNTNTNHNNMASVVAATDQQQHHHFQQQKQQQQQQQRQLHQQQQALKCPRCDSTNTKFCYYNNYSLSQPRHFCRACKRYWTRGGTLRNVPVGGGCRKNKRVRRSTNTFSSTTANTNTNTTNTNNNSLEASINSASSIGGASCNNGNNNVHDLVSSTSNHVNYPLFYGLPTNHSPNSDINFPFSRYDLQNPPQINGLGLGFSSGLLVHNMHNMNLHHPSQNTKQISHDLISSNPLISSTTTNITSTNTPSTISSLLHQIKGVNNFQTLLNSYHDGDNNNDLHMKNVKIDHHHHNWSNTTQNQIDHHHHQTMVSSSDPSILWGSSNGTNLSTWLDPSNNLGSSVPSLI
ncbi:unnamed protein product [Amaranthus hypochondriacus]